VLLVVGDPLSSDGNRLGRIGAAWFLLTWCWRVCGVSAVEQLSEVALCGRGVVGQADHCTAAAGGDPWAVAEMVVLLLRRTLMRVACLLTCSCVPICSLESPSIAVLLLVPVFTSTIQVLSIARSLVMQHVGFVVSLVGWCRQHGVPCCLGRSLMAVVRHFVRVY